MFEGIGDHLENICRIVLSLREVSKEARAFELPKGKFERRKNTKLNLINRINYK